MDCREWALYCDLDGSLLNSFGEVTKKSRQAIRAFVEDGGLFGLCTGRATQNAFSRVAGVEINAPSIVFNGAAVYDYAQKTYLRLHLMDKMAPMQAAKWSVERFPEIDVQVYTPDEIIYVSARDHADAVFLSIHQPCRFAQAEDIRDLDWVKCLLYGKGEALAQVERYIIENGLDARMGLVHSSTDIADGAKYLEFVPLHTSKGTAVELLRGLDALQGRRIAGFGDYYNDIDFLQAADYAFAPRTGIQEVKDIAYKVVSGNNENPVCDILRELRNLA
ncbi:MAG: HAD-IIB family hydrolase [Clostridia bacterium]|nr:HAD-IIB family hydrolase [Clostridia bacterium]